MLQGEAGDNPPVPSFFRFLTLVAFHLFCAEKVSQPLTATSPQTHHTVLSATTFSPPRVCLLLLWCSLTWWCWRLEWEDDSTAPT